MSLMNPLREKRLKIQSLRRELLVTFKDLFLTWEITETEKLLNPILDLYL